MTRCILALLTLAVLALAACAPSTQPTLPPASQTSVSPAAVAPTLPAATNPPPLPTPAATNPPTPRAAADQNTGQALDDVARMLYEAWTTNRDVKPYIKGVMTAFDVPPLGDGDTALATTRLKQGLPLMFMPQVAEMEDAFKDRDLMSLDSFIAAANDRGAKQKGTNKPLTREYLTLKFATYVGQARYEEDQVLPAFLLALSRERAKQMPTAKPDPLWGDGLLDPLQVTLLLYAVSYAGPERAPAPMAQAPGITARLHEPPHLDIFRRPVAAPLPASPIVSAPGEDPVVDFVTGKIRGRVTSGVQDMIEVPLEKLSAVQVSVCASLLLYGHQMTVTATPNLLYHKDGNKPSITKIDAQLTFEDNYWDNYLSVDRWMIQNGFDCKLPRRGPVAGKPLEWEVTKDLIPHGNFDMNPPQTGDQGEAIASWRTVPETTPEDQRTFQNQRDAVGTIIVRASGLVPGWSGLERAVNALRDTGGTGNAQLRVIYYELPYYQAHGAYASEDRVPVTGMICALDKPFTLKVDGRNPSGGEYVGEFAFTPAGTGGGSWTHKAKTCELVSRICAMVDASGTYQVQGVADGKPIIVMNPSSETMLLPAGDVKRFDVPGWQFDLAPQRGTCPAQ